MTTLTATREKFSTAGTIRADHLRERFSEQMNEFVSVRKSEWTQAEAAPLAARKYQSRERLLDLVFADDSIEREGKIDIWGITG